MMEKFEQFVYLLKVGDCYKIGRTVNLLQRLDGLRTQPPFEIELLHAFECDDYTEAEEMLHSQFTTKHKRGEWFLLNDKDIAYICSIDIYYEGEFHCNTRMGNYAAYSLGADAASQFLMPGSSNPFVSNSRASRCWWNGYHDCIVTMPDCKGIPLSEIGDKIGMDVLESILTG